MSLLCLCFPVFSVPDDLRHTVVVLPAFGTGQVGTDEKTYSPKFHIDLLIFLGGWVGSLPSLQTCWLSLIISAGWEAEL